MANIYSIGQIDLGIFGLKHHTGRKPMNFKVTFANGTSMKLTGLPLNITMDGLRAHLFKNTSILPQDQHIMTGYPPKIIEGSGKSTLTSLGVRTGSVLVLKEAPVTDGMQVKPNSVFIRRVMPADNSCLFHSIGYALGKEREENGPIMRQLIKDTILANPGKYSEVFLGRPVYEYCAWIIDDKSWGGEIELSILSTYYKVEMVVFDVTSMSRLCYGEDQGFTQRLFLLYDGIHYDLVVENFSVTALKNKDVALFSINDFTKVSEVQNFVAYRFIKLGLRLNGLVKWQSKLIKSTNSQTSVASASCAWCVEALLLDRKRSYCIRKLRATNSLGKYRFFCGKCHLN